MERFESVPESGHIERDEEPRFEMSGEVNAEAAVQLIEELDAKRILGTLTDADIERAQEQRQTLREVQDSLPDIDILRGLIAKLSVIIDEHTARTALH